MSNINIYEIINSIELEETEVHKLQIYLINNQEKKDDLLLALTSHKTKAPKQKFLRNFLNTIPDEHQGNVANEDLKRFWKLLKYAEYDEHKKSLSLLQNTNILGDQKKPSVLFIRKCYDDLKNIIFDWRIRRLRISGNPGIGKTYFGYYLLYHLAKQNATVVYHKIGCAPIVFSENTIFKSDNKNIHALQSYLDSPGVWYVVDGQEAEEYRAKTILICSPRKDYYRNFDKYPLVTKRFMPVWTRKEIYLCRDLVYNYIPKDMVEKLYSVWGGNPRFVLEYAFDDTQQDTLEEAIKSCKMEIFDSVGEIVEEQDTSHKIIHIHVNLPIVDDNEVENDERGDPTCSADNTQLLDQYGKQAYTKKIIKFASNYVKDRVINKLETDIKNKLRMETKLSLEAGISNSLFGQVFEQIAHKILRNGGNFHIRHLAFNTESIVTITNQDEILEFSENDIDLIEDGKYYQPESKNFPSIDSIIAPDKLFQMTIAKCHPIKMNGLKKLHNKLGGENEISLISFYFVIPAHLYEKYSVQPIHNCKDELAQRIPDWINDRLQQYVLKIDL